MAKKAKLRLPIFTVLWVIIYCFITLVYFNNLTIDVFGGDSGDLATSAITGGVAHPPGYPLFLILGRILSSLPLPLEPVSKVALVSTISSVISLIVFKLIIRRIVKNFFFEAVAVLTLAFSYLFWLYTEVSEVFALNNLLFLLVILFSYEFYKSRKLNYLLMGSFAFGLGLSNHHTVIFSLPVCITVLWLKRGYFVRNKISLLLIPSGILLGLVPYLYLLIASKTNPPVNWNEISNIWDLIHHFLRIDYGTFSGGAFPSPISDAKLVILKEYLESTLKMVSPPVIALSLLGIVRLVVKEKAYGIPLLSSLLISGPFFIVYAGFPLVDTFVLGISERFYLLSHVILLVFFPVGLAALYRFLLNVFSKSLYAKAIIGIFTLIPIFLFIANLQKTNLSQTRIGTNFAKDYLRNLTSDSVLFLSGDTRSFNIWYVYYVLRFRNDVQIVQLGDFGIRNELYELEKREISKSVSGNDVFVNTVLSLLRNKEIYSVVKFNIPKEYIWLPIGMNYKLYEKKDIPTVSQYNLDVANALEDIEIPYVNKLKPVEQSLILRSIPPNYSAVINETGNTYYEVYQDVGSAERYYNFAKFIDPTFPGSYVGLTRISLDKKNCAEAEENIKTAVSLDPVSFANFGIWYTVAKDCFGDPKKMKEVEQKFEITYGSSLQDLLKKDEKNENE